MRMARFVLVLDCYSPLGRARSCSVLAWTRTLQHRTFCVCVLERTLLGRGILEGRTEWNMDFLAPLILNMHGCRRR